jgi:hypothetical protein
VAAVILFEDPVKSKDAKVRGLKIKVAWMTECVKFSL